MAENNCQRSFSNSIQLEYANELNKTISELNVIRQELQEAHVDIIHRLVLMAEYKGRSHHAHESLLRGDRTENGI